jgi:pimeloyl-[acyl-carrier protein] synthase
MKPDSELTIRTAHRTGVPYGRYKRYADLQERNGPVFRDPSGVVVALDWDAVRGVLSDPGKFSSDMSPLFAGVKGPARKMIDWRDDSLSFLDDPVHAHDRRALAELFTPRGMASRQATSDGRDVATLVADTAQGLFDKLRRHPQDIDLMRDFADPLPVLVIMQLLDVPPEDFTRMAKWSKDFMAAYLRVNEETIGPGAEASDQIRGYFAGHIDRIKASGKPTSLLMRSFLEATKDDKFPAERLSAAWMTLFLAGEETTGRLIGNGIQALLLNRDQLDILRKRPDLRGSAVKELMRYDTAVHVVLRRATDDMEFMGVPIKKDDQIFVMPGAANRTSGVITGTRDMSKEPDLDSVRVDRYQHSPAGANGSLVFGYSIHGCLGARLAATEMRVALDLALDVPDIALRGDVQDEAGDLAFRGPNALEVEIDFGREIGGITEWERPQPLRFAPPEVELLGFGGASSQGLPEHSIV